MPTILQPQDNESPDSTQALTGAVIGNSDTGHSATTSDVSIGSEESDDETKTCRWFTFSRMQARPVILQFDWSISGSLVLTAAAPGTTVASALFRVEFSKNGGANWSTVLERPFTRNTSGTTPISDSGSLSLTLPDTANTGPVQIRNRIAVAAQSSGDPTVSATATLTAEINGIQLEVTPLSPVITMW